MLLAFDQGGTKTVAALCDEHGKIVGVGYGFGACHFSAGLKRAMEALSMAAEAAMAEAGITCSDITDIMAGLAGANWPDEIEMLENSLRQRFGTERVKVYNDCVIALRAGSDNPDAMVICGGSGLNCALRHEGQIVKVYNNHVIERDQGGGALGMRAVEAVVDAEIAIHPPTVLREIALEFFDLPDVTALMLAAQRSKLNRPTKEFVFPLFEAAEQGDVVANEVIEDFGKSVARYVGSATRLYDFKDRPFDVVLSGGLFKAKYPLLRDTIGQETKRYYPHARLVDARYEPIVGAAVMGLEWIGKGGTIEICKQCAVDRDLLRLK